MSLLPRNIRALDGLRSDPSTHSPMAITQDAEPRTHKRGRGRPRTAVHHDNWFGIEDPRERKRIQDRLAQRARRKRLEMQPQDTSSSNSPESEYVEELPYQPPTRHLPISWALITASKHSNYTIEVDPTSPDTVTLRESSPAAKSSKLIIPLDHYFLCWAPWSFYTALVKHGLMFGTTCSDCELESLTPPEFTWLPEALRPTLMQLTVPHRRWIDRFPFPRMRDNLIYLQELIDLDDFCGDLFSCASFVLRNSCATWDPKAWTIGPEFAAKWGYLLF